jgi:serine/threonine-protein kinase
MSFDDHFEQVLADFLQAEERGERPDTTELLRTNRELETPLREFFHDRARFERLAPTVGPPAVPPQPEPPPVNHFGSYTVLEKVGQGGRGIVYRVSDPELNRPLAVKVLRSELLGEPDAVRRFQVEAQVMGQLQHPGIVPVHSAGQLADGRPYFVMKLVQGRTLAQLLADRPDATHELPRFLVIFQQVCQAVAYAHSRGVIHRDLKPANVMVGAFAEVQVMDWGLAKVLKNEEKRRGGDEENEQNTPSPPLLLSSSPGGPDPVRTVRTGATGLSTVDGLVVGTFAYMAPEQAKGRAVELDSRADVFGLGAVLCEILTGLPPFLGHSRWEVCALARSADLADALARLDRCGADAELVALAKDCLAPQREQRPQDAAVVAERLTTYLSEVQERLRQADLAKVAAQARTDEARATARAERRARRLTVGLAVAVLAVVTSLTVGGLWLQQQQAGEARQTEALRRDVDARLTQAIHFRQSAHFQEAHELLEQAQQRLGADEPSGLREQVVQALADTELARRLDAARLRAGSTVARGQMDFAGAERDYAAALQGVGLGEVGQDTQAAAARVCASGVHAEIVVALDDWASITRKRQRREWLLAVARAADPDPERDRLRQPDFWRDKTGLSGLAGKPRVSALPPQLVVALGRALVRCDGDPVPLLRQAQARHPDDFWLNYTLGSVLREKHQYDEAISYLRASLAQRPRSVVVHNALGIVLGSKGELEQAIGHFQEAFRIDPKISATHDNLGTLLSNNGRHNEAIGHFKKALDINSRDALAHANFGATLLEMGQWKEGVAHFKEALRIDPELALAHNNLGSALESKGQLDEALGHFAKALRIDPRAFTAHNNLGLVLYRKGQYDEAIKRFEEALRLNPNFARAHNNLGLTLLDLRRFDEAIGHCQEAVRLEPKFALAHNNLGLALKAKGRVDEAIWHFKEAIKISPSDRMAYNNLGNALLAKGQVDEAIGYLKEAVHLEPSNAKLHISLGRALQANSQLDEAIDQYKEALRFPPELFDAHIDLGLALSRKGQPDKGIEHLERAIKLAPNDAVAHGARGQVLLKLGRLAEARDATLRSLKLLGPQDPLRRLAIKQLNTCVDALGKQDRERK